MLNLEKTDRDGRKYLRLTLTDEGRNFLNELVEDQGPEVLDGDQPMWDLLDDRLCNGWERVYPEDIGALTDAPIISDDLAKDDHNHIISATYTVYAWMDYQSRSVARELYEGREVEWVGSIGETESRFIVLDGGATVLDGQTAEQINDLFRFNTKTSGYRTVGDLKEGESAFAFPKQDCEDNSVAHGRKYEIRRYV